MNLDGLHPSFWEHVEQLRNTVLKCLLAIFFAAAAAFICFDQLYPWIISPIKPKSGLNRTVVVKQKIHNTSKVPTKIQKPDGSILFISESSGFTGRDSILLSPGGSIEWESEKSPADLVLLGPMEGMAASLKISLWIGLFASSPFCCFFILQFIYPALQRKEKGLVLPFAAASILFLFGGAAFAYSATLPFANQLLGHYNESLGINLWTVSHYVNYTLVMVLSSGIAFELMLILLFLVHIGVVSDENLKKMRPLSYVGAFILSAVLTPPDIFTQIFLALPMIGIYEASIVYAKIRKRFLKPQLLIKLR